MDLKSVQARLGDLHFPFSPVIDFGPVADNVLKCFWFVANSGSVGDRIRGGQGDSCGSLFQDGRFACDGLV